MIVLLLGSSGPDASLNEENQSKETKSYILSWVVGYWVWLHKHKKRYIKTKISWQSGKKTFTYILQPAPRDQAL